MQSWHNLPHVALIAQLVEHCTGNTKVVGSNPDQSLNFFQVIFSSSVMAAFASSIISHLTQCSISYPNTSNFVKNTGRCMLYFHCCKLSSQHLKILMKCSLSSVWYNFLLLTSNTGHLVGTSVPKFTDHHEISAWISAASNALLRPL